MEGSPLPELALRAVRDDDISAFFGHQRDERAVAMAGFPAQNREQHRAHWDRIRGDESVVTRTITEGGLVASNIVSWLEDGCREIGYWVDPQHWGRGIASRALLLFLEELGERPLTAHVAAHNVASIRVLERAGFRRVGQPRLADDGTVESVYELV
jgi:RimJ/RimL family protein N-acetyltransferase